MKPPRLSILCLMTVSAMLATQCARRHLDAYWLGDADAIGSTVLVDGRPVAVLAPAIARDGAFIANARVAPCYEHGDTVAHVGEPMVAQHIAMPRDEHRVTVISARGDTLTCIAQIWDSPKFVVHMKCRALLYPGLTASDMVRADTKQGSAK
jgi:hypothetical protein